MKLSVIIPVYNELATIARVIREVQSKNPELDLEIVVVDDGSTDGTVEEVRSLKDPKVKLICHPENRGKGAAIRTALAEVTGDAVIIQDADLEYDPSEYKKLLEPIISGRAQVVYGARTLEPGQEIGHRTFYLGGVFLSWLTRMLYWCDIEDEPTCYKLFKTDVIRGIPLRCTRFEFCPEVTAKILKRGIPIVELPIHYRPRKIHEGKKIRWRDGVEAIWTLLKYRFVN